MGAARLASLQGSGNKVVAQRHDQTVRDLSMASQLQQEVDPRGSGVCHDAGQVLVGGTKRATHGQQNVHVLYAASCCASPTAHLEGSCA